MSKINKHLRVGLLCVRNDPLLILFISRLIKLKHIEYYIIYDDKNFSSRDLEIINSRTNFDLTNTESLIIEHAEFLRKTPTYNCNHNSQLLPKYVENKKIDLLLNIGTTKKISGDLLDCCSLGIINIHPGMLPDFRGSCAVEWAILKNKPIVLTAHKMNSEYDSGDIIRLSKLNLSVGDSYKTVRTKVYLQTSKLFSEICILAKENKLNSYPQEMTEFEYCRPIDAEVLKEVKDKLSDYLREHYAHK